MYTKFYSIDKEKQQRIINACLSVFAKNGYKKSTVDEIVKEADISKGLIFHYFSTKKNLFSFLFEYCSDLIKYNIEKNYDKKERDFFRRINNIQRLKLETMKKHPKLFDFLICIYFDNSKEAREIVEKAKDNAVSYGSELLFDNVQTEKFKEGTDIRNVYKIIMWTAEGFIKEKSTIKIDNIEKIIEELNTYLNILKNNFYKGEYL